ncbi:TPA: hypothetical protein ACH3X3_003045 [Trebouxia sp. C0006]
MCSAQVLTFQSRQEDHKHVYLASVLFLQCSTAAQSWSEWHTSSLFFVPSLVQPVLSYSYKVSCLNRSSPDLQMKTVRNHFMKRTFHMRKFKFVSDGVVLCESGGVLTQLHGQKMLLSVQAEGAVSLQLAIGAMPSSI